MASQAFRQPAQEVHPTVEAWLTAWLADRNDMSSGTRDKYRGHIENHLIPALGDRTLVSIRPEDVERLVHDLLSHGLAAATVRRILGTLRAALSDAVDAGLLAGNPTEGIDLPSADGSPLIWSPADVTHFLRSVREDSLEALWRLVLVHRVRRSEVLDLHWTGVDLRQGVIDLRAVPGVDPRLSLLEDLANPIAGDRFVTMDPQTQAALREYRRQQAARRLRAGRQWFPTDLVFTEPDGRPLNPWGLARRFADLGQAAGLPPLGLNEVRRRAASPERDLIPRRR